MPGFICAMEDVLEVYHRQFGDNEVLVCLDETSKQQVKETRKPMPPRPGTAKAYDFEYERNGVSNLFMLFAPLEGWRRVEVTDQRTKVDWARVVRKLVDVDYPGQRPDSPGDGQPEHTPPLVPVRGLRACGGETHCREAGNPLHAQARQLAESCPEPADGMAEIELGVLARQCLDRRIPCQEILRQENQAWQSQRNRGATWVNWRFTTGDARIKLKSLYPGQSRLNLAGP